MSCAAENCPLLRGEDVKCEAYRVFGNLQDAIMSNIQHACPFQDKLMSRTEAKQAIHKLVTKEEPENKPDSVSIPA